MKGIQEEYLEEGVVAELPNDDEEAVLVEHHQDQVEHGEDDEGLEHLEGLAEQKGDVAVEHHVERVHRQNPAQSDQRDLSQRISGLFNAIPFGFLLGSPPSGSRGSS